MKIGVDARPLSYPLTGIGIYLRHVLDGIQRIDRQNEYYLISNAPIDYDIENPGWHRFEGNLKRKLLSTLWMQVTVPWYAAKMGLDLFWATRHHLPALLPPRIRTVVTVHDVVHRRHPGTMPLPNLLVDRALMALSLKRAAAVIAVSQATAADIREQFRISSARLYTIHHGISPLPAKSDQSRGAESRLPENYFLFVGTLDPRKNFERIFRAFEILKPEGRGLHLVIVGAEGWKNHAFLKMVRNHPLRHHVHLEGYIPRDRLLSYYQNSICLVFPSLYEGFGLPILEAMACGTPVLTSNGSSMSEVAGDAALLVNPYDTHGIAVAMDKLSRDQALRKRLIHRGLERVVQFSWKKCAAETLNVLNSLKKG
jgi:glycosyltransferase involved in cell wall biosynthesis